MNTKSRISLYQEKKKSVRTILKEKGLVKMVLPKASAVLVNLIQMGPRVLLRSAFQVLRANIVTRIVSAIVILVIDLYSFAKRKISLKQLIINIILSCMLLIGGTVGWNAGTNVVVGVVAENTVIWILAGIVGAGVLGSVLDSLCKKILSRFIRSDVEDMVRLINVKFEEMVAEQGMSDEEAERVAEKIKVDKKICVHCFQKSDRNKFVRELLEPYF